MDTKEKMAMKLNFESSVYLHISQLLSSIDTFKGSWSILEQSKSVYLKELRKIATIESVGSSTRIEGATLSDEEVEKLLKSVKINKLESRDEQEVFGYYEALELILENYKDIPFIQSYIHQLHGILLRYSGKDQSHKGRFKSLSNQVVANYPDGSQRIIFRTTEPHLTSSEMEALLLWVNDRLEKKDLHPLLIVASFVYEFLSIHPYQDGNGRLSRLLTTLLLLKLDYGFVEYVSFEYVVENKKEAYYRALMDGQRNRYNDDERIDKWIIFFLNSLVKLTKRLEVKYDTYSKLKLSLNERQQAIVSYLKEEGPVQISDVESHLEVYSRNTIKKDLSYLVKNDVLLRTGSGRGVRYHFKKQP